MTQPDKTIKNSTQLSEQLSPTKFVSLVVRDIKILAEHVASQPRGYMSDEAVRAGRLHEVDMDALCSTIDSVVYVSTSENGYGDQLTQQEQRAYAAARRLQKVLSVIEKLQEEIQAELHAA